MHEIKISSYNLPLIREVGHMTDIKGESRHPDRLMKKINVFIYVKKGTIQVFEDQKEYVLQEGTYLFLRKNIYHWGEKCYAPETEWYYIHFYDSFNQNQSANHYEYSHFQQSTIILENVYDSYMTLPKYGKLLNPDYTEMQLLKILKEYDYVSPIRPLNLSALTFQFFIELYMEKIDENKNSKSHHIVRQIIALLRNSESRKLTSGDISNAIGMNYAYLSTLFKQQTGKSINQLQNELLIEKAINIFKRNSNNVSEVSEKLGFSNPYYFSRVFKKITGVSPSMYLSQNYRN